VKFVSREGECFAKKINLRLIAITLKMYFRKYLLTLGEELLDEKGIDFLDLKVIHKVRRFVFLGDLTTAIVYN